MKQKIKKSARVAIAICLLFLQGLPLNAQNKFTIKLWKDSTIGFAYPDTSNFFNSIILQDTTGLKLYNSVYPDSIVINKRKKTMCYNRYDGKMVEAKITTIYDPVFFFLHWQVFELQFSSGLNGQLILFSLNSEEKMALLEWQFKTVHTGFMGQLQPESAKNIRSIDRKSKSLFANL